MKAFFVVQGVVYNVVELLPWDYEQSVEKPSECITFVFVFLLLLLLFVVVVAVVVAVIVVVLRCFEKPFFSQLHLPSLGQNGKEKEKTIKKGGRMRVNKTDGRLKNTDSEETKTRRNKKKTT